MKIPYAKRNLEIPEFSKKFRLLKRVNLVKYTIGFSINDISYQIVYPLGNDLKLFYPCSLLC